VFYGALIGDGTDCTALFVGYLIGAGIMIVGGVTEIVFGSTPSVKSLESVAKPLTSVSPEPESLSSITLRASPVAHDQLFHASRRRRGRARFETRMQLLLPEREETVDIPECDDRDPIESGLRPLLDRLDVPVDVRTVGNGLCDVVLAHILRRRFEVDRVGQLGLHLPPGHAESEQVMRDAPRARLVVVDRHCSRRGSVATIPSPARAARAIDSEPPAAT
jgi:hypothetical protein